ncbi:MAG TPA: LD-carboxypeptidase [Thermoanaerobaculia bacterium]|nr:LD-carboxypeptidase [Thermoanaerobaculia bacterium]
MIHPVHLPPAAGPGDRVGVAALSGPIDPRKLERGVETLRRLGFEPVLADNLASRHGFFAGTDAERLAAFHRLAADPDLPAILFARGGHGVLRVLPGIDWDLLARRPRAYMGFSDLTPFLLEVVRRLRIAAFHGPMVAADLARGQSPEEEASFLDALAGRYPAEQPLSGWVRPPRPGSGTIAGPLLGGCLSLLTSTLGTPYFPDLAGALLFIEDVNEEPYRIDRLLTHLRLSDNLAGIAGMIAGHFDGLGSVRASGMEALPESPDWGAVLAEGLEGFDWPIAMGLECGHFPPNRTLPLGIPARLEEEGRRLVLGGLES